LGTADMHESARLTQSSGLSASLVLLAQTVFTGFAPTDHLQRSGYQNVQRRLGWRRLEDRFFLHSHEPRLLQREYSWRAGAHRKEIVTGTGGARQQPRKLRSCPGGKRGTHEVPFPSAGGGLAVSYWKVIMSVRLRRLIPLSQARLYVVGAAWGASRRFCEDCLA
jgi:hypothetical protein